MHFRKLSLVSLFFFFLQSTSFANSMLQEVSKDEKKIDVLLAQADKLKYDDNSKSFLLVKEAEKLASKEKSDRKLGEVYTAFGTLYYINGAYDISLEMHLKALKIHEKYKLYPLIGRSLNGIGLVQMGLNHNDQAIKTFTKCSEINKLANNFAAVGRNYFNISLAQIEEKEYNSALVQLRKALKLSVQYKDLDTEHMIYSRLGEVKLILNEVDSSLFYYKKLFNHPVEPSNWEKTYSYAGLANTYMKMELLDEAEKYGLMSFQHAKNLNAKWDIERSTYILSEVYSEKKEFQNAYKFLSLHKLYNDSLYSEEKIREINYQQLQRKEAENTQLQSETKVAQQKEKNSKIINYSFILLVFFLLGILFLLKKNIRLKDKFNQELTNKNNDIENQKTIIASQNEILEGLNKSKNHLFSILSHDLKSPINSIFQVLELQQQGDLTKEIQEEIFQQLLKQVEGTSMMLNNLLHWANTQMDGTVVHFENINLNEIVNTSVDSFYMEAFTKKIVIQNSKSDKSYFINADLGQVRIIVQNVLANAIKFTPLNGNVDVFYSEDRNFLNLHIIDSGAGMSQNVIEEIINYDKRMSSEMGTAMEKGTGLGLLLVKQFLMNNNGKMDFKSKEGEGTEFIISFLKAK